MDSRPRAGQGLPAGRAAAEEADVKTLRRQSWGLMFTWLLCASRYAQWGIMLLVSPVPCAFTQIK